MKPKHKTLPGYPSGFYPLLVLTLLVLFISGLVLVPHYLTFRLDMDHPLSVSQPMRLFSVIAHSGSGLLLVFMVGALSSVHMRAGLRRRNNVFSGISLCALISGLCISALMIYYAGDERLSLTGSTVHLVLGLLLGLLAGWHLMTGRRIRLKSD